MVQFPNAKINLGLNVTAKREDGYHNIETLFYPIPLFDVLEVIRTKHIHHNNCPFFASGLEIQGSEENNLCLKAYQLLKKDFPDLPTVEIYLFKNIPMGAGLGGGSANGAFMLSILNEKFHLSLSKEALMEYALQLGSDCPFFINNKPSFACGRGELLESVELNLKGYTLVLVNPGIHVSTATAFSRISPYVHHPGIKEIINTDISNWKNNLLNDFEETVFFHHPPIKKIKAALYNNGAVYASMTGTGSSVYGLFKGDLSFDEKIFPGEYFVKKILL